MRLSMLFLSLFVSAAANAASGIEYGTDVHELKFCGPITAAQTAVDETFAMTVPKVLVTQRVVRTPIYTCESSEGNGKGDWRGFYDQAGDKANQLNDAILGVGKAVAPHLVPYFQRNKPRSWSEFSARIEEGASAIERSAGIPRSAWAPLVLFRYKQENMENLGYYSQTNCRITGYREEVITERTEIGSVSSVVHASVAGSMLLPHECETLSVVFRGTAFETRASEPTNTYRVGIVYSNVSRADVTFTGTRNAIAAANLVDGKRSTAKLAGNVVQATLLHPDTLVNAGHPAYSACRAEVTVEIQGKKKGIWGPKPVTLATQKFPLEMGLDQTSVSVSGVQLDPKQKLVVKVSTSYLPGCPFFSTAPSGKRDVTVIQ